MKQVNTKPVIDISWWQDPDKIDYEKLSKEIDGAIIRIGFSSNKDGTPKEDNRFRTHYDSLKKHGVPVGGYWYSTATSKREVMAEVYETLRIIDGLQFELPIAWDTEDARQTSCSKDLLTSLASTYCTELERAGYYTVIYSFSWWLNNRLRMDKLSAHDVWVADLSDEPQYTRPYGMWQYTWTLRLNGYAGDLDGNHVYKDYAKIVRDNNLNGFQPLLTMEEIATEVVRGLHGSGQERFEALRRLGYDPRQVQAVVNKILAQPKLLPIRDIATRVIKGLYGNGQARFDKLTSEGYDPAEVQKAVNDILQGK